MEIRCWCEQAYLLREIPSATTGPTNRMYCPECGARYYVVNGDSGTTLNPEPKLVRRP